MKRIIFLSILFLSLSTALHAQNLKVYDETINPMEQIDQAVAQAKQNGHNIICQVGGNWCRWCLIFANYVKRDSTINQLINDNYEYIHVNYNPRANTPETIHNNELVLKRLNSPQRFGFPVLVILNSKGKVIHIQDSSFLEEGQSYNAEKVIRFLKCWTPKAVDGSH